jgi:hypothetical protein
MAINQLEDGHNIDNNGGDNDDNNADDNKRVIREEQAFLFYSTIKSSFATYSDLTSGREKNKHGISHARWENTREGWEK